MLSNYRSETFCVGFVTIFCHTFFCSDFLKIRCTGINSKFKTGWFLLEIFCCFCQNRRLQGYQVFLVAYFCRFWTNCSKKCHIIKYGNHPFGDKFLVSGNTAPRQNNWPEIGGHDIWKVTKIKVKKFGPHSVASKIYEELKKQKSN